MTKVTDDIIISMKIENFSKTYKLDGASIDEMSERIGDFLQNLHFERTNILRVRLSVEEALLRWKDHFGTDEDVSFELSKRFGRPSIKISLENEPFDPLSESEDELGEWADALLSTVGLEPRYVYQHNANSLLLRLPKPKRDPAQMLLISVFAGLLIGALTSAFLPEGVIEGLTNSYLQPVQELFFRILNVAAVPIIFLDVLSAACGAGNVAEKGKNSRKMVWHFIMTTTVLAFIAVVISIPVFGILANTADAASLSGLTVIDALKSIIPTDIMTPFQTGESQQLIFLALVIGNALLIAGNQVAGLVDLIEQCHAAVLYIAEWVSRVTPLFVVILLVLGVWDRSLWSMLDIWKPVALFAAATFALLLVFLLGVSISKHVSVSTIVSKLEKPFRVAFRYSSVNASYGLCRESCVRRLGIDGKFTDNTLPLGLVLFMPASAMATVIFTLYAAKVFNITTGVVWILTVLFLAVALQTASPPVAGVNLLAYAAIFSKVGIPSEALILAMIADILLCFLASAMDQAMLQIALIFEADRAGVLDRERLESR